MLRPLNPLTAVLTFLIGVALVFCCRPLIRQKDYTKAHRETETNAVYSAVINDLYIRSDVKLLVIQKEISCMSAFLGDHRSAVDDPLRNRIVESFPSLDASALDDYLKEESECSSLENKLDIPVNYVLVSSNDFHKTLGMGDWSGFYAVIRNLRVRYYFRTLDSIWK
ncbi:MAG TPA: hypothetical protein VFC63_21405 [Blastocatellia bacterium]|nr:hypothetical protein [Blastocatellia bacterium]